LRHRTVLGFLTLDATEGHGPGETSELLIALFATSFFTAHGYSDDRDAAGGTAFQMIVVS
jgi:hypothetical protein